MKPLMKVKKLQANDLIATVSLSSGIAGEETINYRYLTAKKRLETDFQLKVIEMPNALKGIKYIYEHPEKRAEDLMDAFKDPNIKGVISMIGGEDSIRLLPYIDFNIIASNPKPFIGYSDTTIIHFICLKAGITSFYGPSMLAQFGENINLLPYTLKLFKKSLFETKPIGTILAPESWTSERIEWMESNNHFERKMIKHQGYQLLQGTGIVEGRLIGGCMDVLEMIKNTTLWPSLDEFDDTILFLETSELKVNPVYFKFWLRNYAASGILNRCRGIIFGKPTDNKYFEAYNESILIIIEEYKLFHLAILVNLPFGHTDPMITLPYGAMAQINCEEKSFAILESGTF